MSAGLVAGVSNVKYVNNKMKNATVRGSEGIIILTCLYR